MHTRYLATGISALAVIASPAVAGDEVLFAQVPEWVLPADLAAAVAKKSDVALFDRQIRLEDGTATVFTDLGYVIETSQQLRQMGTVQMAWLPDKGDLTVNRLQIIRDGQIIDLLEQGVRPEVIRREQQLESRSLNGMLTALTTVPDLRIGDVLRMSTTTTSRDQALMGDVQTLDNLVAEPARIGFGRYILSWPEGDPITWSVLGQVDAPQTTTAGGYTQVQFAIPIEKPEDMPEDAPGRFTVKPSIHAGSFSSWPDVARTMAPHFATEGTIASGGLIAAEVARIEAATDNPLERAALALQSVQDEISYLANGMDGGNYLPQSPRETWTLRYGDCKAKSLLLLAMLREMGITADTVLVDTDNGDAVSVSAPVPGAFNHMIVRAQIDGEDYWLDGTSAGSRLNTIYEVPNFKYALPLKPDGAELVPMIQRWPKVADRTIRVTYDMSGGVDLPGLVEIDIETTGVMAAQLQAQASETDKFRVVAQASKYVSDLIQGVLYDAEYSFDDASGVARLKARGLLFDMFEIDRNIASHAINTPSTKWSFTVDRSRKAWRDIPFQLGGPYTNRQSTTFILPSSDADISISGEQNVNALVAGRRLDRAMQVSGKRVVVNDGAGYIPAEIAPADIPVERVAMQRFASGDPTIRIANPQRSWELTDREIAERFRAFDEPVEQLFDVVPDDGEVFVISGMMRQLARKYDAAIGDFDRAITADQKVEYYEIRAEALAAAGRHDEAIADLRVAYDMTGEAGKAATLALAMSRIGRSAEALELLENLGMGGDDAVGLVSAWSEIAGGVGRGEEGWAKLDELLAERPGDPSVLNSQCWMAGVWNFRIADAEAVCNRAVREDNYSASSLDSRALVKLRLDRPAEALEDLNAALRKSPGQAASLYLRGIIRLQQGDLEGRQDITYAERILPTLRRTYALYGLTPDP